MFKLKIVEADREPYVSHVATLLRDYRLWLSRAFVDDPTVIDEAFDPVEWESELADLPGHYGAPTGAMVVALVDDVPAGCAIMRGIGTDVCEVRHLFVRPAFAGHGIARCLMVRIAQLAALRGYRRIRTRAGAQHPAPLRVFSSLGLEAFKAGRAVSAWAKDHLRLFEGSPGDVAKQGCAHLSHAA